MENMNICLWSMTQIWPISVLSFFSQRSHLSGCGIGLYPMIFVLQLCAVCSDDAAVVRSNVSKQNAVLEIVEDLNVVDKKEDPWTISRRFKNDIAVFSATADFRRLESPNFHDSSVMGQQGRDATSPHCRVAVELGAHTGLTTHLLSRLCVQVWALENSLAVLRKNMARNLPTSPNINFIEFHSVFDDWDKKLPINEEIDFILIDAAHDHASVINDIEKASLRAEWLILDDYGAEKGVQKAVQDAVARGIVKIHSFVGEEAPWTFEDRTVHDWEGIILRVNEFLTPSQRRCHQHGDTEFYAAIRAFAKTSNKTMGKATSDSGLKVNGLLHPLSGLDSCSRDHIGDDKLSAARSRQTLILEDSKRYYDSVNGTEWFIYQSGVFLSGDLRLLGKLEINKEQSAIMRETRGSDGAFQDESYEYRIERDMDGAFAGFVFKGQHSSARFQLQFRGTMQSGVMWSLDGDPSKNIFPFLLVRSVIVRTIGEKLLSTLY